MGRKKATGPKMTSSPQTLVNRFLVDQDSAEDSPGCTPIVAPFRIGRMEGFDLSLPSPNVSALHAEILEEDGELWVYDLGSTNGTFVNDERVRVKTLLKDDDTIVFGNRTFRLIFSASESLNQREVMATISSAKAAAPTPSAETSEQRFQRLLDDGTVPFFQPVFEISEEKQRLVGYEVLGRGTISGLRTPEKMFAAALPLNMESELSRVFRRRGIEAAEVKLPKEMKLFVNTHPGELNTEELEESLNELRAKFTARPIVLELPQTVLKMPSAFSDLRALLKKLDIGLAIHDFGAGEIHLAELNEVSPDIVKFDCDLVQRIDSATPKHLRLVRALVQMVKELGITPMAEQVETAEEHEILQELGIGYAQGFYYGRPNDIDHIVSSTSGKEASHEEVTKEEGVSSVPAKVETGGSNKRPAELMRELVPTKQETDPTEKEESSPSEGTKDADWLLQQPQDHYTIQLMMAPKQHSAVSFLANQSIPGEYALYAKLGKSKTWYVVLCGTFEDRDQAKAEAEKFKKVGISPLVRRFSSVHTEIRKKAKTESA